MVIAVAFVALAATGTVVRAVAGRRFNRPGAFPIGTLLVNVGGSFALGLLHRVAPPAATILGTGLLGATTTFSTLVADTAVLARAQAGRRRAAATYLAVTLVAGLAAAATGRALAP